MFDTALAYSLHAPLLMAATFPDETWLNTRSYWLLGVVLTILAGAYVVGRLCATAKWPVRPVLARDFNERVRAWWMMAAILVAGCLLGYHATVFLFFLVSFWALQSLSRWTPTQRSDHRTLFWVFFVITPAQYVLVALGEQWYPVYSIMIPVFGWLFLPSRIAFSGDAKRFLERSAKMLGPDHLVYSLATPPLLDLTWETRQRVRRTEFWSADKGGIIVLLCAARPTVRRAAVRLRQTDWSPRDRPRNINASRTWEGFCGGVASTTVFGVLLYWVTPFGVWGSACMAMVVAIMGFLGGMTMSAIKRDRGVKDYGTLVQGHAGVLDRVAN